MGELGEREPSSGTGFATAAWILREDYPGACTATAFERILSHHADHPWLEEGIVPIVGGVPRPGAPQLFERS